MQPLEAPLWRSRAARVLSVWNVFGLPLLGALAGFVLASSPLRSPATGLDPSWIYAAEYAYREGLTFGRDFAFTSGPLSFVYTRLFHPQTYAWLVLTSAYVALVYACAVWVSPRRGLAAATVAMLLLCFAPLDRDALLMSLPFLIFVLFVGGRLPVPLGVILVVGLAIPSLSKFSVLVAAASLSLFTDIHLATRRRFPYVTFVFAVSLVAVYRLSGQPLSAFTQFLAASFDAALGYGQTMGNFGWGIEQTLLVGFAAAIAGLVIYPRRSVPLTAVVIMAAGYAVFALLMFKLANVRSGHQTSFWTAMAVVSFALVTLPIEGRHKQVFAATFASLLISVSAIARFSLVGWDTVLSARTEIISQLPGRVLDTLNFAQINRLTVERSGLEQHLATRVPPDLQGTVASWPWEFSELIAAKRDFVALPSFQGYANYTKKLRNETEAFFSSPTRPQNLFFQLAAIDGRYRSIELGPALIAILSNYDVVRASSKLDGAPLQLRSRVHARPSTVRQIEEKAALLGQWVAVPKTSDGLSISMQLRERPFGKLLTTLYRQAALELDLQFADGTTVSSSIFPNLVADGFLVVPPEMNEVQLFAAAQNGLQLGATNPLAAVRVRAEGMGSKRFSPGFNLAFGAVQMAGIAEYETLPDLLPRDAMDALVQGRVLRSSGTRMVEGRLLAHASTTISALMPHRGLLTGEIGFFDGAWRSGKPNPVTFSISAVISGKHQLLFERTLNPVGNPADRGSQQFSIDLTDVGSADGPVELLFATGPDTPWGWTYWARLSIAR